MKFFRISYLVICVVILPACSDQRTRHSAEARGYLNLQIKERIRIINEIQGDSALKPDAVALDKRANEIILISKDIENIQASIRLANRFFAGLAEKYNLSAADFVPLNSGMHVDDIERLIKQNELSFFNLYILRSSSAPVPLSTAH